VPGVQRQAARLSVRARNLERRVGSDLEWEDVGVDSDRGNGAPFEVKCVSDQDLVTTGDGLRIFAIPDDVNGMHLVQAQAFVTTVSSSGVVTVQLRNITQAVDMLSTRITIDVGDLDSYAAAAPRVIDTANDQVFTGDQISVDVDVAGTGTTGLGVILRFDSDPAGTGAIGPQGETGAPGAVWRSGSGVPSDGTGVDGDLYLRTTNGDLYQRSGGTYSVIANIIGPAASSSWVLVADEPGDSVANFTADSGSWTSDGSVISVTTSGSRARLRYTSLFPTSALILECEMKILSSGIGAGAHIFGFLFGWDGAGDGAPSVQFSGTGTTDPLTSDQVRIENDGTAGIYGDTSQSVALDTWYKLRVVVSGVGADVYVDDVLRFSSYATRQVNASYVGLVAGDAAATTSFRNFKLWRHGLPED